MKKIESIYVQIAGGTIPEPEVRESFSGYFDTGREKTEPSSFNGDIQVVRYRFTKTIIEEPMKIYHVRLQKLWEEGDNWHHKDPLEKVALELGYELKGNFGDKCRKDQNN